jgi:phosphoribosylaminoimidazole-succinocarboxamide synthase
MQTASTGVSSTPAEHVKGERIVQTLRYTARFNQKPMADHMSEPLFESKLNLNLVNRGKVRDIYEVDAEHLLIVTSDRLSAFDVIMPQPIPGKGEVLTRVAKFWFARTQHLLANHLADIPLESIVTDPAQREALGDRAMVVRKLKPLPVESIVRGYLIGSGWKDYQQSGLVCGIPLPAGLQQADKLPEAIFTPSTKAELGAHDENIDYARTVELLGQNLASQVRDFSLQIYREAADYALERGIIIADTKFEFGLDENGGLHLIDEVLTPDSSRFWPADQYRPGISPPSFDKQFVRDYLETLDWDKTAPGPDLPQAIINKTAEKYREAEKRLTGG